jgi:hypothetical protein
MDAMQIELKLITSTAARYDRAAILRNAHARFKRRRGTLYALASERRCVGRGRRRGFGE